MAFKAQAGVDPTSFVEVELKAEYVRHDYETGVVTLRLDGVKTVEVDWMALEAMLTQAGMEKDDAMYLMEGMARRTESFLMAKAIAGKMRRVG